MQLTFPDSGALYLEARSGDGSIARSYAISVSPDLFGWTIVDRQWGRIGSKGQVIRSAFENEASAEAHVRALLRRRATAHARIGVAYCPVTMDRLR